MENMEVGTPGRQVLSDRGDSRSIDAGAHCKFAPLQTDGRSNYRLKQNITDPGDSDGQVFPTIAVKFISNCRRHLQSTIIIPPGTKVTARPLQCPGLF